MSDMFCFQCQQTAGGSGCVRTGVCGKQPTTAHLQDILVCRLIRLAEVCEQNSEHPREVTQLLADGLFTTLTNVNFDDEAIRAFTARVEDALRSHGGDVREEDPSWLWRGETDLVSLRSTLLFGLKGMAAYNHHVNAYGKSAPGVDAFLQAALAKTLDDSLTAEELTALALEPGKYGVDVMAALDEANVVRYARYMRRIAGKTQFIVITHRRGTMEEADVLYGVTMQERGVSRILTINLNDMAKELNIK